MALVEHLKMMAQYHQWAHERLLHHVEPLSDDEYYQPCGLYFTSVHGTLNHLLLGDRLWHGRFVGEPVPITGLDQVLHSSRNELLDALSTQARCWHDYVAQLTERCYSEVLTYQRSTGERCSLPKGELLGHVFNHATHHRGQLSTIITQLGYRCPEMDLVYFLLENSSEY